MSIDADAYRNRAFKALLKAEKTENEHFAQLQRCLAEAFENLAEHQSMLDVVLADRRRWDVSTSNHPSDAYRQDLHFTVHGSEFPELAEVLDERVELTEPLVFGPERDELTALGTELTALGVDRTAPGAESTAPRDDSTAPAPEASCADAMTVMVTASAAMVVIVFNRFIASTSTT